MKKIFMTPCIFITTLIVLIERSQGGFYDYMIVIQENKALAKDAEQVCKENSMSLIEANSQGILDYLQSKAVDSYWVDLHYDNDEKSWVSSNLDHMIIPLWSPGEPKMENCVFVAKGENKWKTRRCTDSLKVICLKRNILDNMIVIFNTSSSRKEAEQFCQKKFMKLIRADNSVVLNYLQFKVPNYYWIDLHYDIYMGGWVHSDSTNATTTLWEKGEPKIPKCAIVDVGKNLWTTSTCLGNGTTICQRAYGKMNGLYTFEDSVKLCQIMGLSLIRVDTDKAMGTVCSYGRSLHTPYWIDAKEKKTKNKWIHADGTNVPENMWPKVTSRKGNENLCAIANWMCFKWKTLDCALQSVAICSFN